jgi:hypothetical protein
MKGVVLETREFICISGETQVRQNSARDNDGGSFIFETLMHLKSINQ